MAVATRERREAASRSRLWSWSLAIVPLALLCALVFAVFAAEVLYAGRALPGLAVAGVSVGSLDGAAINERLESELARPWAERAIVATYEGTTWRATNGELSVRPDIDAATASALAYGKTGPLAERLGAWMDALRGEAQVPLVLRAEGDALERWVRGVAVAIDRPAVSGELALTDRGLAITEPVVGRELDRVATTAGVLAARTFGDREIALRVRALYPAVDESGFREAVDRARALITPLEVVVEDRRIAEDAQGLATLLSIARVAAKSGELPALPADAVAPATRYRYIVGLNEERAQTWVTAVAAKLDRPAKSARFTVSRENVLAVVPGATGIRVEQDRFLAHLRSELFRSTAGTRAITAPAAIDIPAFSTEQAEALVPKLARTSTFTTYFPVSRSRYANIATGSSQFDGVVILPGQTFSFWELLGPVTVERGYAYAGAIINNRSDDNVIGGGLCQVSTTMFNAIARLGYEIVERHAHGYLIERYPIGLDAAVFDPGVDFRWKNDTASPVFLWSWVSDTSVTFDVWGLPTGRTVVYSDPVQKNFVPVPPTQPADPAFPAGYSVPGRDVWRTRTVYEDGKVLHQDLFFSHYAPVWGGPAPAPTPAGG